MTSTTGTIESNNKEKMGGRSLPFNRTSLSDLPEYYRQWSS